MAQGWDEYYGEHGVGLDNAESYWQDDNLRYMCDIKDYHPTRNKGQAMELAMKSRMSLCINEYHTTAAPLNLVETVTLKDTLIAVTIAFILAMQGDKDD